MRLGAPEKALGNIMVRENRLPDVGDIVDGHKHNFDHTTFLMSGRVRVTAMLRDGKVVVQEFAAPDYFLIKAGVEHKIEALSSNVLFWCVYAHRDPQGTVVQEVTGWREAYQ